MSVKIWFDVQQLYYLPQYEPVYQVLQEQGCQCHFFIYSTSASEEILTAFQQQTSLPITLASKDEILHHYQQNPADWIIFGNGYKALNQLPSTTRTALLYHGIGVKECYYDAELAEFDVRFTEGAFRQNELQQRYPNACFVETGFAKLDPLADMNSAQQRAFKPQEVGLSPEKPLILYAPTFYPSSIELMGKHWPETFSDCNIVIKPHFFSYTHKKYAVQRKLIDHWASFDNVYVVPPTELSLVPYMAAADLLISEASSALFEFAALDKPIIWLDFFKLRWGYRGPLRFRFTRRMDQTILKYADVGSHVAKPAQLEQVVRSELANPALKRSARQQTTEELIGRVDGQVSQRIANYLLKQA